MFTEGIVKINQGVRFLDHPVYRVGEGDGAPLKPSLYLEPFSKQRALKILGSRPFVSFEGHLTSSMTSSFDPS